MKNDIDSADHSLGGAAVLRRATVRLARRLRAERGADGLSAGKLGVLGHLYRHGPATPGDVAAAEHQLPQSLTRVFAELERDGLLTRSRNDRDSRQAVLAITAAGRAALERDAAVRDRWLAAALGGLTEAERSLLRIAAALMDRLADSAAEPE
ncbi:MarR family winged helix-turn-helix transcriptional regulator [Azospirillum sp. ST 5-10]|uniref:MarR family winged helix-turn-helix transcriptional regulator n=1 Tax=unclassified Azospirillum TaxID=2630922 RepID=UPI003F4A5A18